MNLILGDWMGQGMPVAAHGLGESSLCGMGRPKVSLKEGYLVQVCLWELEYTYGQMKETSQTLITWPLG